MENDNLEKRAASVAMLTLLLASLYTMFNVPIVKATGTIYIRADGSIDPPTAPIQRNGSLYTLTDNVTSDADGIVIQRNNIVLDGAGHTVQGTGNGTGIYLSSRSYVTITSTTVTVFFTA